MIIPDDHSKSLQHYGILRKSGRYPWGSGANASTPLARAYGFAGYIAEMKAQGLSDTEICQGISTPDYPFTTTDLRATKSIARNAIKAADIATAERYKADGYSNVEIGKKFNPPKNESTVRALLAPGAKDRGDRLAATAQMLKDEVADKGMIEVGKGTNFYIKTGVAQNHLDTAVAMLKSEGYVVHNVQVPNLSSPGNKTLMKVLAPEGTAYKDIVKDIGQVKSIVPFSDDNGRSFSSIQPPLSISSKRLKINYEEDGGGAADGVIYVRPGKKDLDLGVSNYAQVRIMIDNTHFIKGMAIYKDDLPDGVDLAFNTNKRKADIGADKTAALKKLKRLQADGDPKDSSKWTGPVDQENPFGSIVRQLGDRDDAGRITKVTSAMNLVNEPGDWDKWSNTISAQMLSKQKPSLIKERLDETYAGKKEGLDEILALTNPAVRRKLLESYADDLDAAAVHLKAKGLPRQETKVILPMNSMKPTEVYAPTFKNGESVVLVRYPHGGKFEIPELTVNNNHRAAKKLIGQATDAIGIHSKVAERLSGADFDGDTVVVIPNPNKKIRSEPPLQELIGFNPQVAYRAYEGMPKLSPQHKQRLMGQVSNLITDMTIRGAANHEIAQAVRHSMVVIDAEKHNLNYRQSHIDNNIASLKKKYQGKDGPGSGKANSGASTLISQAKSPIRIPERKLQKASQGGSIDPKTGAKIYRDTNESYPANKNDPDGPRIFKTTKVKKLEYVDDAHTLSSGTPQEKLYADHSNRLKALANETRLAMIRTEKPPYSESAARVYNTQVSQLTAKLNEALKNAPRERQAQVLANAKVKQLKDANPDMDKAEKKKLDYLALAEARARVGAKKTPVYIEDDEWEAIQAGAVRPTKLRAILDNADPKRVKTLATPRTVAFVSTAQMQKAQRLLGSGATQAEAAAALGISVTTLKKYLNGGG